MSGNNNNTEFLKFELSQLRGHIESRLETLQNSLNSMMKSVEKVTDTLIKVNALETRLNQLEHNVRNLEQRTGRLEENHVNTSLDLKGLLVKMALVGSGLGIAIPIILTFIMNRLL